MLLLSPLTYIFILLGYTRTETSRIKPLLDKKDTSHPPVTYRPIARTGSRSRDPSPIDKSEKSSSSSSGYNYNKLYPRPYQRSVSRERTESLSSTTIPKYVGRSSTTKDDPPRYGGRSSITKDEIPKYSGRSSISKDEPVSSRFKVGSRATSKEDLSGSQKYINSRFLPKNSVEKSYTASYSRPSNITRSNETSRKNRELLNVLHAQQEQERLSRPSSRCSSVTPEDIVPKSEIINKISSDPKPKKEVEMVTITVVNRGTSPTQMTQPTNFLRSRRLDIAKTVEKQIIRPKTPIHTMVDKEMQSDRMDDSTKSSRFVGASRISSTPWSSFLDMKFSSPSAKQKNSKSDNSSKTDESCESPKTLSRTSSNKSAHHSCTPKEKIKESKSASPPKSKIATPKQVTDKKLLPPQIPKSESTSKSNSLHSINSANKDFRKSVLNMNPEGKSSKKLGRRSNSASSADSDANDPDATDVSENLATCKSYHSKIQNDSLNRRSPSSEPSITSATTSGSEDDTKTKKHKKKLHSAASSRTSINVSSADELPNDKRPKPPQSPRTKTEGEAKSFLMRALAPVTSLFKVKQSGSAEKVNWMDPSSESNNENSNEPINILSPNITKAIEPIPAKIIIHRVESGEKPWWLQENENANQDECQNQEDVSYNNNSCNLNENSYQESKSELKTPSNYKIAPQKSGELAWWLDESAEIPEGVETYPNWVKEDGTTEDGRVIYKIRKYDSDESSWWLSASDKTNTDSNKNKPVQITNPEYLDSHKLRHIDSGERAWWMNSSENVSEQDKNQDQYQDVKANKSKYPISRQDSGERAWWLEHDNDNQHDEYSNENLPPLGDRASPEGLEMPKDEEGRQSPYDNVPSTYRKNKPPSLFISKHTNIDDILGGSSQMWSPFLDKTYGYGNKTDAALCNNHESYGQAVFFPPAKM